MTLVEVVRSEPLGRVLRNVVGGFGFFVRSQSSCHTDELVPRLVAECRASGRQHVQPVKCAGSQRDISSNLAERLLFPHLCTTYRVPGKQPPSKHQSVSIYLPTQGASPSFSMPGLFLCFHFPQVQHILPCLAASGHLQGEGGGGSRSDDLLIPQNEATFGC